MTDPYVCATCGRRWVVPSLAKLCKHQPQKGGGTMLKIWDWGG